MNQTMPNNSSPYKSKNTSLLTSLKMDQDNATSSENVGSSSSTSMYIAERNFHIQKGISDSIEKSYISNLKLGEKFLNSDTDYDPSFIKDLDDIIVLDYLLVN